MRAFVPHSADEIRQMLARIGVGDIEDLFASVPEGCRFRGELNMEAGLDEFRVMDRMEGLARRNRPAGLELSFLGGGVYNRIIPAVVAQILSRPEFYSAYTPYQPEVAQGTLQVIFEFQTLVARLTGLPVANASLYDGGSALGEAVLLAAAATGRDRILIPGSLQPGCRRVLETYCRGQACRLQVLPWNPAGELDERALGSALGPDVAAVVVQNPNSFGIVEDLAPLAQAAHKAGALCLVHAEPTSLGLLEAPGHLGADIVTAEGQSLGLPMNFGGPYLGLMAVSEPYLRRLPGRLVGATQDGQGRSGYVLTLQTREQHIRREKATSNICTNQGLMALAATVYLAALGEEGFRSLAEGLAARAAYLAERIAALPGCRLPMSGDCYQEFVVETPLPAPRVLAAGLAAGIHAGLALGDDFPALGEKSLLVTVSEKHSTADLDRFADFLGSLAG